ncbi:glycosyltransferase [Paenibacillus sp. SC116]|uniref:tetratricopeptide repeat-containing glycosyltransferase family 2 protein n=1 Tax=Paenibacillus sp. SC116 TaxID=2968986 RepID=UPI00215AFED0|nr:glycosyltransferase [Paenibacillus sp. SC116]MCR8845122.1 glycosyltransferase [Paenibacillus sp. SC116]
MKLSVCLIVRNEQRLLPDCLHSIRQVADEIIVVDTGSTDHTIAVAKQAGAVVLEMQWNDDFAAARNLSLSQATGKWVLILDADERLAAESAPLLRKLVEGNDPYEGYFLRVEHVMGDGLDPLPMTVNPLLRLFRNREAYRFEGAIHEQIAPVIIREQPTAVFAFTPIRVHHLGYQPQIVSSKDKIARNIHMLEQIIEKEGRQPFHLFNLAVEKLRQGDDTNALALLREAREITPLSASFTHLMIKIEAWTCARMGKLDEAVRLCTAGIEDFPDYTDLRFALAVYYDAIGNRRTAIETMREAARIGTPPSHYHTEGGVGTFRAHMQLGAWALEARAWSEAALAFDAALEAEGCPAAAWLASVRLHRVWGDLHALSEAASQWLQTQPQALRDTLLSAAQHGGGSPLEAPRASAATNAPTAPIGSRDTLQTKPTAASAVSSASSAAKKPSRTSATVSLADLLADNSSSGLSNPPKQKQQAQAAANNTPIALALSALSKADIALARLQQYSWHRTSAATSRLLLPLYALALSAQTKEASTT